MSRRILMRLATLVLATLLALGLGEVAVRIAGVDAPSRDIGVAPHPQWHHWHRPNSSIVFHVPSEGLRQNVSFNEHGMRDSRSVPMFRTAKTPRVAVLGDSFVEAMQVREEEGLCRRLEAELRKLSGEDVEVLNFGCSGFSTSLQLILLREFVLEFDPDVVVLLHHFSDVTEDWKLRDRAEFSDGELRAIRPARSGLGREVQNVLDLSQMFRVARSAFDRQRRHRPPPAGASLKESFDAIMRDPCTADDEEAWSYSLSHLKAMADLLRRQRKRFLVVFIPLGPQVEPVDAEFAANAGFRWLGGGQRLEQTGYQRKMTQFCHTERIAFIDLLDAFRAANPDGSPCFYLPHDQHWTAAGHELAAKGIAETAAETRAFSLASPQNPGYHHRSMFEGRQGRLP